MSLVDVAKGLARDVLDAGAEFVARQTVRARSRDVHVSRDVRVLGDITRLRLARGVAIFGPSSIALHDGGGLSGSRLEIGENTYVGEFANFRASGAPITIGRDCLFAQGVTIVGSNHGTAAGATIASQPWSGTGVRVGNDVWVGAGAIILPGAEIGDGTVVAANSVVRGRVEAGVVIGGSPARVIGQRKAPQP